MSRSGGSRKPTNHCRLNDPIIKGGFPPLLRIISYGNLMWDLFASRSPLACHVHTLVADISNSYLVEMRTILKQHDLNRSTHNQIIIPSIPVDSAKSQVKLAQLLLTGIGLWRKTRI